MGERAGRPLARLARLPYGRIRSGFRSDLAENYKSAALRHFDDPTILQMSGKIDNAAHLSGFAAECTNKHKISSLRPGEKTLQKHLPSLWLVARKLTVAL